MTKIILKKKNSFVLIPTDHMDISINSVQRFTFFEVFHEMENRVMKFFFDHCAPNNTNVSCSRLQRNEFN